MNIYDFKVKTMEGKEIALSDYKGNVLIVVNMASLCGFTPQYEGLEKLYQHYHSQGLEVLGFPSNQFAEQEPGSHEEIKQFCKRNYGVTFPIFAKIDVRGENVHPLFRFLSESVPFKGFNLKHPIGQGLVDALNEEFPDFLEGNSIKWNFTKFLIDRQGHVTSRYESTSEPEEMIEDIERVINENT